MGILDNMADQKDWPNEQVGGWRGRGYYMCACHTCRLNYIGVKHSSCCYPCAKAAIKKMGATEEFAADFVEGLEVKAPEPDGATPETPRQKRGEPLLTPVKEAIEDFQRVSAKFWSPPSLEEEIVDGMRKVTQPQAPEPMFVQHWIGWHLGKDGKPAPIIYDGNPGYLAHVTKYRFQVPPDVVEHLTGTRECLMLDKFGAMEKDCREEKA